MRKRILPRVQCRICSISLYQQNYQAHLSKAHPGVDNNNKRSKKQTTLNFITGTKYVSEECRPPEQGDKETSATEEANNVQPEADDDFEASIDASSVILNNHDLSAELNQFDMMPDENSNGENMENLISEIDETIQLEENVEIDPDNVDYQNRDEENNNEQDCNSCLVYKGVLSKILSDLEKILKENNINHVQADEDIILSIQKDLNIIAESLSIQKSVGTLSKTVSRLEIVTNQQEVKEDQDPLNTIEAIMKECKSAEEIERKFVEFEFKEEENLVLCRVCGEVFKLDSKKKGFLRVLKNSLKRHLKRDRHTNALQENSKMESQVNREISRNKKVGMTIGRVSYYLIKQGRPYSDFPYLLDVIEKAGGDVGDINHSRKFVPRFLKFTSTEIQGRLQNYFSSNLSQTGHRPPVNIVADKGTWKHRPHLIIGLTTIVPDSEGDLIQCLVVGSPICPVSDGPGITKCLVDTTDSFMNASQYVGLGGDGAMLNVKIGELVNQHYGVEGFITWDFLHRAGLPDDNMRKPKGLGATRFHWLTSNSHTISRINNFFNFGREFEELLQV